MCCGIVDEVHHAMGWIVVGVEVEVTEDSIRVGYRVEDDEHTRRSFDPDISSRVCIVLRGFQTHGDRMQVGRARQVTGPASRGEARREGRSVWRMSPSGIVQEQKTSRIWHSQIGEGSAGKMEESRTSPVLGGSQQASKRCPLCPFAKRSELALPFPFRCHVLGEQVRF